MQLELKHLHHALGVTVVYVTHDQTEALTMSNRVAVFHDGFIQQLDEPRRLYEQPENSFVAHFIGENNTLQGTVTAVTGEECRVALEGGEFTRARAIRIAGVGAPTTLSIRPERVLLDAAAEGCDNRFQGRVLEFVYLGDHVQIRIQVTGKSNFMVKVPVAQLDPRLRCDDTLPVGWHNNDIRALDSVMN